MNKKIDSYFFTLLCCISMHTTELKPLSLKAPLIEAYNKSFESMQQIITENPQLSLAITAIISFIGLTVLLFSYKKETPHNHPAIAEIEYSPGLAEYTLM